ncbi:MAG: hypothetical protein Q8K86_08835 [Candidatus Nanopelagicaceae bacterium]|nr:hypothetical protein [Candidatus Nanopelagicaceae bacterium]
MIGTTIQRNYFDGHAGYVPHSIGSGPTGEGQFLPITSAQGPVGCPGLGLTPVQSQKWQGVKQMPLTMCAESQSAGGCVAKSPAFPPQPSPILTPVKHRLRQMGRGFEVHAVAVASIEAPVDAVENQPVNALPSPVLKTVAATLT